MREFTRTVFRKGRLFWLFTAFAALAVLVSSPSAVAVHDLGIFELDRNATKQVNDDWSPAPSGIFTGIIADVTPSNPLGSTGNQFQGGGSKDNNDITEWLWTPGEPLDKDDITDAYAVAKVNPTTVGDNHAGDLIIYFGMDRFANNGSAQVGFWFLKSPIGLTTTASQGGYKFSGQHTVGDVLVQSNFTQGGVISKIAVFKWVGSGGSNGSLDLIASGADCLNANGTPKPGNDAACATVNQADTPAPWPYTPKFGTSGTFPTGSFFEGGINITRLIPGSGCFSQFVAETRSSDPFDSRLKDFALGNFNLCRIDVQKTGTTLSKVGDPANYTITITNTGFVTLYKDSITDTLLGSIASGGVNNGANQYVVTNTCGASLAPGASCTITLQRTIQAGDPDPLPNTVTVVYRGNQDLSGSAVSGSDDHSVNLFQPDVSIQKTADALSKVGDPVDFHITVTNTGSSDSPPITCTLTDSLLGINKTITSLAVGASDVTDASRTTQAGDPDPLVNTASVTCTVDGFGNVLGPKSTESSTNLFQPSVDVAKTCQPPSVQVGQTITYTCTITNTSSSDSPNLILDSVTDSVAGDITSQANAAGCGSLAPTASCQVTYTFVAQAVGTLQNTVTVHYHPDGFPNDITDTASCSVEVTGGEGCTPGFWKNHTELWDGVGSDDVTSTIQTTDLFNATFGVTSAQSGLADSVTLLDALSVSGSNLAALDRQATAAIVSADASGVNYPYTVDQVIAIYQDAVTPGGSYDINSALAVLQAANELNCPLS
jgi:uncharacterized repeat protein (TIGR01451 family)